MGFIKKLIGGFFAFLRGLFGGMKKSEYFLEADDAQGTKSVTKSTISSAPPMVAAEPVSVSENGKGAAVPAVAPVAVAEKPVQATSASKPVVSSQPESAGNFSTDFLLYPSNSNGRRRPGPSLNRFMDMAKQVKTR